MNGGNGNGGDGRGGPQYPMGPYGGFPFGFPQPVVITKDSGQPQQPVEPPLRAQIALALMNRFTQKTMPQVAVTENSVQVIDGQKLTDEETGVQATACNFLSHYIAGKAVPDIWESQSLSQQQGVPTLGFRCVCSRQDHTAKPDCPFCGGEGEMQIVVRFPQKVTSDAQGIVQVHQVGGRTRNVIPGQSPATPAPQPGQPPRRRPPGNGPTDGPPSPGDRPSR